MKMPGLPPPKYVHSPIVNLLYTSGLLHCYMLDESFCHFKGVGSILSFLF